MVTPATALSVVLTRPQDEAAPWRVALAEVARGVHELPLIDIATLPHGLKASDLAAYDAAMWVSGSAVRAFVAGWPRPALWPPGLRCWAPGPGTARALMAAGVAPEQVDQPDAAAPQFDSEALWPRIAEQVQPGRRLLLVRGRSQPVPGTDAADGRDATSSSGRDWLMQRCRAAGMAVDTVAAYERRCPVWTPAQAERARQWAGDGSVWLFSSAEAVRHLGQLLPAQEWAHTPALATHPRIAEAARALGFPGVRECRPTPDAVRRALGDSGGRWRDPAARLESDAS